MQYDAEHATLTKNLNNTAQGFRNNLNGLNVHFFAELFFCMLNIISMSLYY